MMVTFTRKRILAASCAGLLLGAAALAWSPTVWGQSASQIPQVQQANPSKIDRSLFGSRTGILTMAKGDSVRIDRATYVLAPDALVEDPGGTPLPLQSVAWVDVELPVQYWLGTGPAGNQITQMIVTLAQ